MHRARTLLLLAGAFVATSAVATAQPAKPAKPAKPKLVPGTVGLTMKEVPLRNSCMKAFVQVKKTKRGDDPALVAVLTYPRLTGLNLDPKNEARAKAHLKKFETWFQTLVKNMEAYNAQQQAIWGNAASTPQAKAEAIARMSLVLDHGVHLLETTEIPVNIRKVEDAPEVYCDTLDEKSDPLRQRAKEARAECAKVITDAKLTEGWFLEVCTPPAATP